MSAADKLRDLVRALVAEAAATPQPGRVHRRQAIVQALVAGPPPRVTLKFATSDPAAFPAAYLASYAPTAGDTVWVDFLGPDPLVIGKQAT